MGRPLLPDYQPAIEMYGNGLSLSSVAKFFGVTRQGMWEILKRRGVELRAQKRYGKDNAFFRGGGTYGKRQARQAMQLATDSGRIKRAEHCEACGSRTAVEGHHDDYNLPFNVRWLCKLCHFDWHRSHRAVPLKDASIYTNKRRRYVTHCGETKTVTEWAVQFGINPVTFIGRLNRGWSVPRALGLEPR